MRKLLLLLMGLFMVALNAQANVISFEAKKTGLSGTGYLTTAQTFTKESVTFGINQFDPSSGQMKVKSTGNSAFTFYNTTAINGLTQVRITHDKKTVGDMYMKIDTVEISGTVSATNNIKGTTAASGGVYVTTFKVPSDKTGSFFKIQITKKGSGTVCASKFEIEYTDGDEPATPQQTPDPVISGTNPFVDNTTVSITCEDTNAKIYYQTGESEFFIPTLIEGNLYSVPFEINATTYICAVAKTEGKEASNYVKLKFEKAEAGSGWKLVKSESDLEVGGRYVLGYTSDGSSIAMSTAAAENNKLLGTDVVINNEMMALTDDVMIFTLENGSKNDTYKLKTNNYNNLTDDNYLNIASSSGTSVNLNNTGSDVSLTYVASDNTFKIQLNKSDSRYVRANTDNKFGYYAASNTGYHDVQLFKENDERAACQDPVITLSEASAIEGNKVTVTIAGTEGQTIRYTLDGSNPSSANGTVYSESFKVMCGDKDVVVKAIAYTEDNSKKPSKIVETTIVVKLKPRNPLVTWSVDETNCTAEHNGTYEVPIGTALTITAVNGDKVKVTDMEAEQSETFVSPHTLTVDKDIMVSFATVNSELNLESEGLDAMFTIKKVLPGTPVVTWALDGTDYTGENDSTYNVYAGTQITVTSENAEKIVVTNSENFNGEYNAPYTFTLNADDMFTFTGKNGDGTSAQNITVLYSIVERPAENVYKLITSSDQLKAGNKYVIAYKGETENAAIGNNGNWNESKNEYRTALSEGFIIDESGVLRDRTFGSASKTGLMVFTLGGSEGKWTLTADNYILPTNQNSTQPEAGNKVKLEESYFRMTDECSENTISISGGSATISSSLASGYAVKYMSTTTCFGMAKVDNDYPLVQLYGYVGVTTPEIPVVTYTNGSQTLSAIEDGSQTAINSSTITVTSTNATSINVNGTSYPAVNGSYTFTTDVDEIYEVYGENSGGKSAEYMFEILIDYEAESIAEMHTLSQKQKDRKDKDKWAPVKVADYVFIRGHYMVEELYEMIWVEDANGGTTAIFDPDGEFKNVAHSIENNMKIRNFKVRSAYLPGANDYAAEIISWPQDVDNDVRTYGYGTPDTDAADANESNVYKLQRFHGDITFTEGKATMQLIGGTQITISNKLTIKNNDKKLWNRTEGEGFNWLAGNDWLTGQTKNNAYVVGFVMPEGSSDIQYVVYPAQITNDAGNITGVDGLYSDGDGISVEGGVICAPNGSRIYGLNGIQVINGQAVSNGVYVVVLPDGNVVKVFVK